MAIVTILPDCTLPRRQKTVACLRCRQPNNFKQTMSTFSNVLALGNSLSYLDIPYQKELATIKSSFFGNEVVQKVAAHGYHVIFLTESGKVYGAGNNSHNQCGVPAHEEKERPAQVIALQNERIIDITCGFYHSFFLSERGLFACGKSSNGQLGVGEVVESSPVVPVPQELFHFEKIELVAAGYYTSFVLTDNNTLYAAGENDSHQLGNFDDENLEGRSVTTFTRVKLPTMISAKRLVCVSSGIKHTLLLTSCGHVYGIGVNDYNQLGMLDSSTKTFVQVTSGANYIFAGPYYTVVTLKDTECPPIGWGDNSWDNENGNRVSEKEFVGWPNNITQITGILYCTGATKDKKVYKIFGRGSDEVPVLLEYPEEIKNQVIGKNVHLAGGYSSLFVYFTSESKNVSSFITKLYACQKRENFVDLTILNGK